MSSSTLTMESSLAPSNPDVAAALAPFVESGAMAGAIALVADRERILSIDAVGWADIEARKLMQPNTMVWIASQSKAITATALMMLVDEGLVDLDAPLETYLSEFKGQWLAVESDDEHMLLRKPTRPATVRDTLCHVSGMGFSSAMETPTLDGLPLATAVKSYAITPLQSEPGVKCAYSNAGINTAGRIVEVVSGIAFEQFIEQRLFEPLGMTDTTFFPSVAQEARMAKAYRANEDRSALESFHISQLTYPLSGPGRYPMPAGGLLSTASDCARFCRIALNKGAVGGRRYLSEAAHREMIRRQTPAHLPEVFGLSWGINNGSFGHGGALASNMTIYPDRAGGRILVWLPQSGGFLHDGEKAGAAFTNAALGDA